MKQILDPELPARDFRIAASGHEADLAGANRVTNIFCENALEMALQLREKAESAEITVLSVGPESVTDTLRKALAMKADRAVRVDAALATPVDSRGLAQVLAAAVESLGGFDVILLGRESGDWGLGQSGACLAEVLGVPLVSFVDEITLVASKESPLHLCRQTDEGWERFASSTPVVVTVTNSDDNLPRIPKTRDIMKSSRLPMTTLTLEELGLAEEVVNPSTPGCRVVGLEIPAPKTDCDFVTGDSLDEQVSELAERVAEIVRKV